MADNQEIIKSIISGIESLASNTFGNAADAAKTDAKKMIDSMQTDLADWAAQVMQGTISEADLRWQVQSQKDLIQMKGMETAGIAKIKVDEFKNGVVAIVCKTILSKIGLG